MHGGHYFDLGPYWELAERWQFGDIRKIHCDCCTSSVLAGAAVAFGIMGMAEAIRHLNVWACERCGRWSGARVTSRKMHGYMCFDCAGVRTGARCNCDDDPGHPVWVPCEIHDWAPPSRSEET